jgi:RNA polymerase sigma-70 factor (ECF subfamily)
VTVRIAGRFLAQLGEADLEEPPWLETRLRALCDAAREAWPTFEVDDDVLVLAIATRIRHERPLSDELAELNVNELYLVLGCANGDPEAIGAFRLRFVPAIRAAVNHLDRDGTLAAEVEQTISLRFLVGTDGQPPRILQFDGRGTLETWLRICASRIAIDTVRKTRRERDLGDTLVDALQVVSSDFDLLADRHRDDLKAAFREAVTALTSRQRAVLRFHLHDQLTAEQIGIIFGAHRVTVARWLAAIRSELLTGTRAALARRLNITGPELDTVLRLMAGQIASSLDRLLETPPPV